MRFHIAQNCSNISRAQHTSSDFTLFFEYSILVLALFTFVQMFCTLAQLFHTFTQLFRNLSRMLFLFTLSNSSAYSSSKALQVSPNLPLLISQIFLVLSVVKLPFRISPIVFLCPKILLFVAF